MVFHIFDKDGSGILEREEFKIILRGNDFIPGNMAEDEVSIITDFFVTEDKGFLDMKEFRNKMWGIFNDYETKEMARLMHRGATDVSF